MANGARTRSCLFDGGGMAGYAWFCGRTRCIGRARCDDLGVKRGVRRWLLSGCMDVPGLAGYQAQVSSGLSR